MSHQAQKEWCEYVKNRFPGRFFGAMALDVGSLDVNGNNRWLFDNSAVTGIDVVAGPNVDIVWPLGFADWWRFTSYTKLRNKQAVERYDVIVSTEALEHDIHWALTLLAATDALKVGGLLLLTCATTGRGEHGTRASRPEDAPGLPWPDYYRNITEDDVRSVLDLDHLFDTHELSVLGTDLRLWGIRSDKRYRA